jgi:hypothetical protein
MVLKWYLKVLKWYLKVLPALIFFFPCYFAVPQDSDSLRIPDMHHGMEVRLGLSKGPVCPSFNWFHPCILYVVLLVQHLYWSLDCIMDWWIVRTNGYCICLNFSTSIVMWLRSNFGPLILFVDLLLGIYIVGLFSLNWQIFKNTVYAQLCSCQKFLWVDSL